MPFVQQHRRHAIDKYGFAGLVEIEPGDRCYVHYKKMVEAWKKEPGWRTVHALMKEFKLAEPVEADDDLIAAHLAWQVFFNIHVLEYERLKRFENGDI